MNIYSLKLIFACYDEDDSFENFQVVYYAVSYVKPKAILKHVQKGFDIIMQNYTYIFKNDGSDNKIIMNSQKLKEYTKIHIYSSIVTLY